MKMSNITTKRSHVGGLLVSVIICLLDLNYVACKEAVVKTEYGILIGETVPVEFDGESKYVQRYLGIPYAKPPLGSRRFARPEPFGPLPSSLNASFHRAHCIQTINLYYMYLKKYEQSEDCLYLNVYVPGERISAFSAFPVMIYIHGGSFAIGGSDIYSGDILSAFNDIITVTFNYRLNVFGFLSTGLNEFGNFGLWDMKLAIQWIHENIGSFGGDATRITLFGNSAGGAAVLYLAMFPGNDGLFQRIIAQSGSNLAHWAFQKEPLKNFDKYVNDVGCRGGDFEEIIICLKEKPTNELMVEHFEFLPSANDEFIPVAPLRLLTEGNELGKSVREFFGKKDLIIGVNSQDGAVIINSYVKYLHEMGLDINEGIPQFIFKEYVSSTLESLTGRYPSNILIAAVEHQYTDLYKYKTKSIHRLMDLGSDVTFNSPALIASRWHTGTGSNFFYVFDHKPGFVMEPKWISGAAHTMEIPYILGLHTSLEMLILDFSSVEPFRVTDDDVKLSRIMMTLWSNFAKSGNPNGHVSLSNNTPPWPQFNNRTQYYLNIEVNMTSESVRQRFVESRDAFWRNIIQCNHYDDVSCCKDSCDVNHDVSCCSIAKTICLLQILLRVLLRAFV